MYIVVTTEVVISVLIGSFKFSPSEKEIFWQSSAIAVPTVVGGGKGFQLPIIVETVRPENV
jgi:hypothetical protein